MIIKFNFLFLTFCSFVTYSYSANVLFFFGVGTYSHKYAAWPLAMELGKKGHNVKFISAYNIKPIDTPLVDDIVPKKLAEIVKDAYDQEKILARNEGNEQDIWFNLAPASVDICDFLFSEEATKNDPELYKLIHNKEKYDLIVINSCFAHCGYLYALIHNAKTIVFDSTTLLQWQPDAFGLPLESSWIPDVMIGQPQPLSFQSRLVTYIYPLYWHLLCKWLIFPKLDKVLEKRIESDPLLKSKLGDTSIETVSWLEKNTSLVIMNQHYSTDYARSLSPMFIQAGGMQCWLPDRDIPKDILSFMDKAESGVIYIAFGSSVNLSRMPANFVQLFFAMMNKFPKYRFVWKWEKSLPENSPKNLIASKWMPQKEILAHKNVKLFITHCGLLSIQETMYSGVPIVGLPLFAEQDYNSGRVLLTGIGVIREMKGLKEETLTAAVSEVLENPKYKEKMKFHQNLFRNRINNPIDTALYWTEFILKNDASCLKTLATYQNWFIYRHWDIYTFILFCLTFILYLFCKLINLFKSFFFKNEKSKAKTQSVKIAPKMKKK